MDSNYVHEQLEPLNEVQSRSSQIRVFLGLEEISGHYSGIRLGLERLGHPVTQGFLTPHPFQYPASPPRGFRWAARLASYRMRSALWNLALFLPHQILKANLLAWSICCHDVFILNGNSSFFSGLEFPLFRLFRRKLVVQFHGSDSRAPFFDGPFIDRVGHHPDALAKATTKKVRWLRKIERHADATVNLQPQAHLATKPYVQWMRVGLATPAAAQAPGVARPNQQSQTARDIRRRLERSARSTNNSREHCHSVRVLHCPSYPKIKGSLQIRTSIEKMRGSGHNITYVELSDKPHNEVLKELQKADLVVDQLYSDYPLPGFATEAAWFGKPVLIAGYAATQWKNWIDAEYLPPSVYCEPGQFESELEKLLSDPAWRHHIGESLYHFVSNRWRPEQVAARYLQLAYGGAPSDWMCDPEDIDYLKGCGIPWQELQPILKRLVGERSIKDLGVSGHSPLSVSLATLKNIH